MNVSARREPEQRRRRRVQTPDETECGQFGPATITEAVRREGMETPGDFKGGSDIAALSSCAIEGNELATELLELARTDWGGFMRRLVELGWKEEED